VSGYRLDDLGSIAAEAKDFSSGLCVQTSYESHQVCYPMGIVGLFPKDNARPGRDADYSLHFELRSIIIRALLPLPLSAYMAVARQLNL
jgi:hypothetical protein